MNRTKNIVLYFAFFFLLQLVAMALVTGVGMVMGKPATTDMDGQQLLLIELLFTLMVIAWFLGRKWTPVSGNWLKTRPLGVLAWTIIGSLGVLLPSMWLEEHLTFLPDIAGNDIMKLIGERGGIFVISVLVPLSEEIVFRGAILRSLLDDQSERTGRWTAITISALVFAVAHMNPAQMPHAFLIGLLLGWLYERTRSIVPGIVLHVVNNGACCLLARLYVNNPDITLTELFGSSGRALLASVFGLLIFLPAVYQLHLRMKKA